MQKTDFMLKNARERLRSAADPARAEFSRRFFKTAPGEYGHGDVFIGITVPALRRVVREFQALPLDDAVKLLSSTIHEERLMAVLILVRKFAKGSSEDQERIYGAYLANTRFINNWDLVDASAEYIVGAFLRDRSRRPLHALARSKNLWERRISILSTFHFIKHDEFEEALKIAEKLVADDEDLIHKAVGWMLREIGKRDLATEESFLKKHYQKMPRTMLRYAIEKFPETKRQAYLKGNV